MTSTSIAYTAKYIFDGNDLLSDAAVIVKDNIIVDVIPLKLLEDKNALRDYGETIITAGFVDLQLNGCGGVLFNDDISHNTLETMYQTCLKYGTTSFLPTLITCDFNDVLKAMECIKDWFVKYEINRGVIGLHLEGPFISVAKKGIHPEKFIRLPNHELLEQIAAYTEFFPIKMTIAPEVFSLAQIKFLIENNIILSLGHSNATYLEAEAAIKLGVKTSTHIFNAMSGLSARNPGVIAAILNSNVYAGVIADMLHVDIANLQLLNKIKPQHIYLITDAVTPMGSALSEFKFGGKTIYVKNGMCIDENGILGGANLSMPQAVANCINRCNIDIPQALNMASLIPAQIMGYSGQLGKIHATYRADLIAFDLKTHTCQIII